MTNVKLLRPLSLLGVLAAGALIFTACASGEGPERSPTTTVGPTAAVTNTPSGAQPTAAPTTPSGGAGDAAKGQQLFASLGCSGCHSSGSNQIVGPGMAGIKARAATRKPGMTAEAYIEESIKSPNAFVVEGFPPNVMPATFGNLSAEELRNLIAYLETL